MREAYWGYAIISLGITAILFMWFMAGVTRTDQHNYNLLKETVEAAMYDAVDLSAYRKNGVIRIEEKKFIESFFRRFAENEDGSNVYWVEIYDINEIPPKVSLKVSSTRRQNFMLSKDPNHVYDFEITNNIDAVLEAKYIDVEENNEE